MATDGVEVIAKAHLHLVLSTLFSLTPALGVLLTPMLGGNVIFLTNALGHNLLQQVSRSSICSSSIACMLGVRGRVDFM